MRNWTRSILPFRNRTKWKPPLPMISRTLLSKQVSIPLIAIFIYILIRFKKWQFSTGAIIATAHDALFVIAAFGIAHAFGLSF